MRKFLATRKASGKLRRRKSAPSVHESTLVCFYPRALPAAFARGSCADADSIAQADPNSLEKKRGFGFPETFSNTQTFTDAKGFTIPCIHVLPETVRHTETFSDAKAISDTEAISDAETDAGDEAGRRAGHRRG
jgi:hypothetical protein